MSPACSPSGGIEQPLSAQHLHKTHTSPTGGGGPSSETYHQLCEGEGDSIPWGNDAGRVLDEEPEGAHHGTVPDCGEEVGLIPRHTLVSCHLPIAEEGGREGGRERYGAFRLQR